MVQKGLSPGLFVDYLTEEKIVLLYVYYWKRYEIQKSRIYNSPKDILWFSRKKDEEYKYPDNIPSKALILAAANYQF